MKFSFLFVPTTDEAGALLAPALGRFYPPTAYQYYRDDPDKPDLDWHLCYEAQWVTECNRALILVWSTEPVQEGQMRLAHALARVEGRSTTEGVGWSPYGPHAWWLTSFGGESSQAGILYNITSQRPPILHKSAGVQLVPALNFEPAGLTPAQRAAWSLGVVAENQGLGNLLIVVETP